MIHPTITPSHGPDSSALSRRDVVLLASFYFGVLIAAFASLPAWLCFALLMSIYVGHVFRNRQAVLFYPCAVIPFMFVIRAPDPAAGYLAAIPDILVVFAIIGSISGLLRGGLRMRRERMFFTLLLVCHVIFTFVSVFFHVFEFRFIIVLIRTYVVPLLFLLVMIRASLRYPMLPRTCLRLFVISFTLVVGISLLQYFHIAKIPSSASFLQPTLVYGGYDGKEEYAAERAMPLLGLIPRLNLLTGGSIGSSAAVAVAIAMLCFGGLVTGVNRFLLFFMGLVCFTAALLSASFSVMTPIILYGLLRTARQVKRSYFAIAVLIIIVPAAFALLSGLQISGLSMASYSAVITGAVGARLSSIDFQTVIFGIGPLLVTRDYAYRPDNYIVDVGMGRVLQETGIVNFLLLAAFVSGVIYLALRRISTERDAPTLAFALPFLTMCLLPHQNFSIGPPFYVLFAATAAGILVAVPTKSATSR